MPAPAGIRAFRAGDLDAARLLIGASSMLPLGVANNRAYMHPLTIAVWLGLSSIMIRLLDAWPTTTEGLGYFGLLAPLPALAAVAVPMMYAFDWLQRPTFEKDLREAIIAQDMKDPQTHYTLSPASGFYILENKDKPIGLIALDAAIGSADMDHSPEPKSAKKKIDMTAETAVIRHFYVDEVYHNAGVQSDLLGHAVSHAFMQTSARPQKIRAIASMLDAYKVGAFRAAGFHAMSDDGGDEWKERKVGVFGWKYQWLEITREEWRVKSGQN